MRFILCSSLLALAACSPIPKSTIAAPGTPGILGGKVVAANSPVAHSVVALVGLSGSGEFLCSGVLISENLVLTAAHCGLGLEQGEIVFSTDLSTVSDTDKRPVEGVEVNPRSDKSPLTGASDSEKNWGDLALLQFSGGLPAGYQPAPIGDGIDLANGQGVILAGFGLTNGAGNSPSKKLRAVEAPILDAHFSKSEFSVDQSSGKGVCHGDSGGPAFVENNGMLYVVGIVSRGVDTDCQTASIETRVSAYMDWIRQIAQGQ